MSGFASITSCLVFSAYFWAAERPVQADIELPSVLGSHMVLQRGMPVPIWGKASPGEKITVSFRNQTKSGEADADGKWMVKLDPLDLGDPASMTITGSNTITLTDILVGEVWFGSGQSNMDSSVNDYTTDTRPPGSPANVSVLPGKMADGPYDAASKAHIRDEALVLLAQGTYPQLRLMSSRDSLGWREANPESIQNFSALLFVYGQQLQKNLNVPVGLIFGALGATSSEQWINRQAYQADEPSKQILAKFSETYSFDAEEKKYEDALAKWEKAGGARNQPSPPPAPTSTNGAPPPERPPWADLPPGQPPPKPVPPFHPGDVTRELKLPNKNIGDLYELYVRPVIPYAIQGVLWDQGEGGTGIYGLDQYTLMGALIRSWRSDWGQGEFSFIYVQKPSGGGCALDPANPMTKFATPFASLPAKVPYDGQERANYIRISAYPHTFMVSASDLGVGTHPINKVAYGTRASQVALGAVYGQPIEYEGPVYDSLKIEGSKIRISFSHVGKGLVVPTGEPLQGFAIAGSDKVFFWADAVVDGNTVLVSSDKVPNPIRVRYAWSKYIPWANLFNADGFPALSFSSGD